MSAQVHTPQLSLLIPTYNRAPRLTRLLQNIEDELARSRLAGRVDVLVSDNASTDSTPQVLASFKPATYRMFAFRQEKNLGMDRNVQFLYEHATSKYVWFFADDDILLPGSVARVLETLTTYSPDVLLYSFRQPADSPGKLFDFPGPVEVVDDPPRAVELLAYHGKISIHILRRIPLEAAEKQVLEPFLDTHVWYVPLAYSILSRSARPRLCVIPDVLAVCDDGYRQTRFPPNAWSGFWKVCAHPFAARHAPRLLKEKQRMCYYFYIYFLYQVKAGLIAVEEMQEYDEAIKNLEFQPTWLLGRPKELLSFLLLKFSPRLIPPVAAMRARWRNRGAS